MKPQTEAMKFARWMVKIQNIYRTDGVSMAAAIKKIKEPKTTNQ